MSTCLAIMAHEKAAPTIADFAPQWKKLGLPAVAFIPEGDTIPQGDFLRVHNYGQSAHRGYPAYLRFCHVIETLLRTHYDAYIIAEYDTVNLTADLPATFPGHLSASFCQTFGPEVEKITRKKVYYIALSPWCLERNIAMRLLVAMWQRLEMPKHEGWIGGYLDRWIASVALEAGIPCARIRNAVGWPHDVKNVHQSIKDSGATWVHGWKTKEEFKDLWPLTQ